MFLLLAPLASAAVAPDTSTVRDRIVAPGASEEGFVTVGNPTGTPIHATLRFSPLEGAGGAVRVTGRSVRIEPGAAGAVPYTVSVAADAPRAAQFAHAFLVEATPVDDARTPRVPGAPRFARAAARASDDATVALRRGAARDGEAARGGDAAHGRDAALHNGAAGRIVTWIEDDPEE